MKFENLGAGRPSVCHVNLRGKDVHWSIPQNTPTQFILLVGRKGLRRWTQQDLETFCDKNETSILDTMNNLANSVNSNADGSFFGIFTRQMTSYTSPTTNVTVGVFPVEQVNGELVVYALGSDGKLFDNFEAINSTIKISCKSGSYQPASRRIFLFRVESDPVTYYEVSISVIGNYEDGDVAYQIGDYIYPIPKSMVGDDRNVRKFYLRKKPDKFVRKDDSVIPCTIN